MLLARSVLSSLAASGVLILALSACDSRVSEVQGSAPASQTAKNESPTGLTPPTASKPVEEPVEPLPHYDIHFSAGATQLSSEAMETLTSAVDYLRAHPSVSVKLSGFTDLSGSAAMNMKLAEQRAASAALFLEQSGIDRSRITTAAAGEADPNLAPSGENPTTWNRRVEVEFSVTPSS